MMETTRTFRTLENAGKHWKAIVAGIIVVGWFVVLKTFVWPIFSVGHPQNDSYSYEAVALAIEKNGTFFHFKRLPLYPTILWVLGGERGSENRGDILRHAAPSIPRLQSAFTFLAAIAAFVTMCVITQNPWVACLVICVMLTNSWLHLLDYNILTESMANALQTGFFCFIILNAMFKNRTTLILLIITGFFFSLLRPDGWPMTLMALVILGVLRVFGWRKVLALGLFISIIPSYYLGRNYHQNGVFAHSTSNVQNHAVMVWYEHWRLQIAPFKTDDIRYLIALKKANPDKNYKEGLAAVRFRDGVLQRAFYVSLPQAIILRPWRFVKKFWYYFRVTGHATQEVYKSLQSPFRSFYMSLIQDIQVFAKTTAGMLNFLSILLIIPRLKRGSGAERQKWAALFAVWCVIMFHAVYIACAMLDNAYWRLSMVTYTSMSLLSGVVVVECGRSVKNWTTAKLVKS